MSGMLKVFQDAFLRSAQIIMKVSLGALIWLTGFLYTPWGRNYLSGGYLVRKFLIALPSKVEGDPVHWNGLRLRVNSEVTQASEDVSAASRCSLWVTDGLWVKMQ